MSRGKRYDSEKHLNSKKVFAVIIAFIVILVSILMIKNILTKSKITKPVEIINYFALYKDEKWGILGSNGKTVIEPMYQEMPIVVDSSKDVFLCTFDVEDDGTYKTKVVNSKNEEIFTEYEKVEALENYDNAGNLWYESNVLKILKDGKWGLINLNGDVLTETIYDSIRTIKGIENSLIVEKDGQIGLLNDKGNIILDTNYVQILKFGNEYKNGYITVNQENKYGIASVSGDIILENKYEKIEDIVSQKYFVITENNKQQLIDNNENKILVDKFDEIKEITNSGIIFTKNKKYGFMDFEGKVLIDASFDNLKESNTDIFIAKKDGNFGIIDLNQEEKIPFVYKNISYNKKAGIYISENENYFSEVFNTNFEKKLTGILSELNTDEGFMKLKVEDEYKYYNFKFEEKKVSEIYKNNKIFLDKKDGKYGFIDTKGNVVVEYIYDDATEINKYGYAGVKQNGKWGSIDNDGNIVVEPYYNLDDNLKVNFIGKWHLGLDLNMNYYCDK